LTDQKREKQRTAVDNQKFPEGEERKGFGRLTSSKRKRQKLGHARFGNRRGVFLGEIPYKRGKTTSRATHVLNESSSQ